MTDSSERGRRAYSTGIFLAVLAASLYALNAPLSKILLEYLPSALTAGFLYIGAGIGMGAVALVRKARGTSESESRLTKAELPYTVAMVVLDIAAPIFLMYGLKSTSAASASLLNNFEIVATAIVSLVIFKEKISPRLWAGIAAVTAACILLSFESFSGEVKFSYGALFVLLACVCWGFENNCTRKISSKDPMQIVLIKGIFSGTSSVIIGLCLGEKITEVWSVFAVLAVGFVAYGLSIFFYVHAQRKLGAARTGAYYAISPFIGTLLSLIIFRTLPHYTFFIALVVMLAGAWLCTSDTPVMQSIKNFFCKKGKPRQSGFNDVKRKISPSDVDYPLAGNGVSDKACTNDLSSGSSDISKDKIPLPQQNETRFAVSNDKSQTDKPLTSNSLTDNYAKTEVSHDN